jgi:hypothetical protein
MDANDNSAGLFDDVTANRPEAALAKADVSAATDVPVLGESVPTVAAPLVAAQLRPAPAECATSATGHLESAQNDIDIDIDATEEGDLDSASCEAESMEAAPAQPAGHGWTLALLGAGLAILAACVLLPAIDANRRLGHEHDLLSLDKETIDHQIAVNDEFLRKMADDPQLVERLAQRQMRVIREGTAVLSLAGDDDQHMSPFSLVDVTAQTPQAAYQPTSGILADWCLNPRRQIGLLAAGLFFVAVGLVCGPTRG